MTRDNHDLWTRCKSLHGEDFHLVVDAGFSVGFAHGENKRDPLVAVCLRCGASFTEIDEVP